MDNDEVIFFLPRILLDILNHSDDYIKNGSLVRLIDRFRPISPVADEKKDLLSAGVPEYIIAEGLFIYQQCHEKFFSIIQNNNIADTISLWLFDISKLNIYPLPTDLNDIINFWQQQQE
jgi:hypothetical protein